MDIQKDKVFDAWLVLRLKAGDQEAFRLLFKRWQPKIIRYVQFRTYNMEVAQDIAQETWYSIMRNMDRIKDNENFGAWVYRIANRRTIDWIREKQKLQNVRDMNQTIIEDRSSEIKRNEDRVTILRQAMKSLNDQQQTVLHLFYMEQYTIREISEILEIPIGTVKSRLFHAREHLKSLIKKN